jgi:hypothetical protein
MSRIRADRIVNRAATGAPLFPNGAVITGFATATTFSGNISGTTGTFTGNVSVGGTLSYEDVTNVDSVGIITARQGIRVTGAGITVAGVSTHYNDLHVSGVVEKVAAATTYNSNLDSGKMVLELDVSNSTTYRYSMPNAGNIGIVSFKNMPADSENGSTVTVLFTQNATTPASGVGNTQVTNGIGTNCTVAPRSNGSTLTGLSTAAKVGSATTVTLSGTASDVDFVSFFIHYNGGTNTDPTSYKVYVTSNGNFRFGNVGI